MVANSPARRESFGQAGGLSPLDRLGTWWNRASLVRRIGPVAGRRIADVGCGYDARLASSLLDEAGSVVLFDIAIAPRLTEHPKVEAIVGELPATLAGVADESIDVAFCVNVLEHLSDDRRALGELHRLLAPGGWLVVNVPSWWGKVALETAAFRLALAPRAEMNDHKRYYDPRDLWPLLVSVGFVPDEITCRRHKLGLNTVAVCRKAAAQDGHDNR